MRRLERIEARRAAAGASQLADGMDEMANGQVRLEGGTDQLVVASSRVADGAAALAAGTAEAASGAGLLADGMDQAADGARLIGAQLDEVRDSATGLTESANGLGNDLANGASGMPGYGDEERDTIGRLVAEPVDVVTDRLFTVSGQGATLAPYFMALAAWVGRWRPS